MGTELKKCNIGIIAKKPTINNTIGGPPIKYFNYTAAGLAIIDVGMPETKRLINKYQNGIIATNSIDGLAKQMIQLVTNQNLLLQLQENSKSAFKELNWKNESKKLVHYYENDILGHKKGQ